MKWSKQITIAVLPVLAISALLGVLSGFTDKIDDAYISLTIAKTFADSGTWGLLPNVFADSATSPVPVLILSGLYLIPGMSTALAVGLWTFLASAIGLSSSFLFKPLSSKFWWHLTVGALIFLTPISISSFGLETVGVTAAALWLVPAFLNNRLGIVTACLVALCILRPEALVFALPFLVYFFINKKYKLITAGILGVLGFYFARWILLGSAIPDTLLMKVGQAGTWGKANYLTGLWYLAEKNPSLWVLSALLVIALALVLVVFVKTRNYKGLVILSGIGFYAAAFVLTGAPPYHWYYALPVAVLLLLADFVAPWTTAFGLMTLVISTAVLGSVTTNWGTDKQYEQLGSELTTLVGNNRVKMEHAEIGNIAYHCSCDIRDPFTDPSEHNTKVLEMPGLKGSIFRLNYFFRNLEVDKVKPEFVLTTTEKPDKTLVKTWNVSTVWSAKTYFLYKN